MNKDIQKKKNYDHGIGAEYFAMTMLWINGHKLLFHRYKTPYGEIDIITEHQDTIHFIEVKYSLNFGNAIEYISKKQQKRIINAANFYISEAQALNSLNKNLNYQIDAAIIYHKNKMIYIPNAWEENFN